MHRGLAPVPGADEFEIICAVLLRHSPHVARAQAEYRRPGAHHAYTMMKQGSTQRDYLLRRLARTDEGEEFGIDRRSWPDGTAGKLDEPNVYGLRKRTKERKLRRNLTKWKTF